MEPVLAFLVEQGWVGIVVLGMGWLYRDERRERRALQDRLEAAQRAHSDAHVATIRETAAALASVERAIVGIGGGPRG